MEQEARGRPFWGSRDELHSLGELAASNSVPTPLFHVTAPLRHIKFNETAQTSNKESLAAGSTFIKEDQRKLAGC